MATKKKTEAQIKAERLKNLSKARKAKAQKEKKTFVSKLTSKQIVEGKKKRATSWAKRPTATATATATKAEKPKRVKKAPVKKQIVGFYEDAMGRTRKVELPTADAKKFFQAKAKTPELFKKGRNVKELVTDWRTKSKPAKFNKETGKWYREWVGKDGKKHREYRVNRLDAKWGI